MDSRKARVLPAQFVARSRASKPWVSRPTHAVEFRDDLSIGIGRASAKARVNDAH